MHRIVKNLITVAVLIALLVPTFSFAGEQNAKIEGICISDQKVTILVDDNGNIVNQKEKSNLLRAAQLIGTKKVNHGWIGYLNFTPNWSKASGYTLLANQKFSASGSYNWTEFGINVGVSVDVTKGVNTHIPADSSKFSRLGAYADMTIKRYKTTAPVVTIYNEVTYENKYVEVVYQ